MFEVWKGRRLLFSFLGNHLLLVLVIALVEHPPKLGVNMLYPFPFGLVFSELLLEVLYTLSNYILKIVLLYLEQFGHG